MLMGSLILIARGMIVFRVRVEAGINLISGDAQESKVGLADIYFRWYQTLVDKVHLFIFYTKELVGLRLRDRREVRDHA